MNTDILKLRQLAAEIRNYQLERGWSDARLVREISGVGSSKTYKSVLDPNNDLEDYDLAKQLRNFQSAVEAVNAMRKTDRPAEPEYEDFDNVTDAEEAVRRASLEDEECVARLVIIEGETSTGKDAVKRHLLKQFPNNSVALDANELWKMAPTTPLNAIYVALEIVKRQTENSTPKIPRHPKDLLMSILDELKNRKLILIINEAHHIGLPGLNMVKTIINESPVVIVLIGIPKLLTQLLGQNYEEAIQLTGNRLAERVYLNTPQSAEILLMLERRGVKFESPLVQNTAAQLLQEHAPAFGNWRFVIQVTRKLFLATKRAPVKQAEVNEAIAAVKSMRTRIRKPSQKEA
jgi:type II secretory pathway predicted ATPase ExeA